MRQMSFINCILENPVIAAIKSTEELEAALESPAIAIFLLGGNIGELKEAVETVRLSGKKLLVHIDLLEGLGNDYYAIKYLKDTINPDGIITTRSNIAKHANECELFVIQRFFLLDSMSYDAAVKTIKIIKPNAIEIIPGIIPRVIRQIKAETKVPIIAGGLVRTKHEAIECLEAGAIGVSTTSNELWYS